MPQTALARLETDVQNAGVVVLPCFAEALMPVIDSANNCNNRETHLSLLRNY